MRSKCDLYTATYVDCAGRDCFFHPALTEERLTTASLFKPGNVNENCFVIYLSRNSRTALPTALCLKLSFVFLSRPSHLLKRRKQALIFDDYNRIEPGQTAHAIRCRPVILCFSYKLRHYWILQLVSSLLVQSNLCKFKDNVKWVSVKSIKVTNWRI